MLNSSTKKPRSNLMKHIQKKMGHSVCVMKIQALPTEMFKDKHKLCPETISYVFIEGTSCRYNLRCKKDFRTPLVNRIYHGTECIAYREPKRWDTVQFNQ